MKATTRVATRVSRPSYSATYAPLSIPCRKSGPPGPLYVASLPYAVTTQGIYASAAMTATTIAAASPTCILTAANAPPASSAAVSVAFPFAAADERGGTDAVDVMGRAPMPAAGELASVVGETRVAPLLAAVVGAMRVSELELELELGLSSTELLARLSVLMALPCPADEPDPAGTCDGS